RHFRELWPHQRRLLVDGSLRRHRHRLARRRGQSRRRRHPWSLRDVSIEAPAQQRSVPPAADAAPAPGALTVSDLDLAYRVRGRDRQVLRSVSFRIGRGESYGLVGESGCGKSTVALAAVRYLPRNRRIPGGRILVDGRDMMSLNEGALRDLRANTVSMVYQDPGKALNPALKVGRQMAESFKLKG